jgi:hypothetical protein
MADVSKAHTLQDGIVLDKDDTIGIFGTDQNPDTNAEMAPSGSIILNKGTGGGPVSLWQKQSDTNSDWVRFTNNTEFQIVSGTADQNTTNINSISGDITTLYSQDTYLSGEIDALSASAVDVLDDLSDADTTTAPPVTGDTLVFDGVNWVPSSAAGAVSNNFIYAVDQDPQLAGAAHATGLVILTSGSSGSVDGITVNGVQIMSGAESFDTDLATTAENVAKNISDFTSSPNYGASADGVNITIYAEAAGITPNGFVVVSSTTSITTTDVNMSGGTVATINTFVPVFFGSSFSNGWIHNDNTPTFKCNVSSVYSATVGFNVEKAGSGSPEAALIATKNGTEILGSHQGMDVTSNNTAFSLSRTFLFEAAEGDEIRVLFAASKTTVNIVTAPDPTGTATPIAAAIAITRLT